MASEELPYGPLLETTVRVASWNVWWRYGDWEDRFDAIVATLRDLDADVIGLQEVWEEGDRNQAALLAEAVGLEHHAYASRVEIDGVGFGNAVLSRWPISGTEERALPCPERFEERRLVLRADIEGPRGPLQFFVTHLNWRFDQSAIRVEQVRTIAELVADSPARSFPPVLVGDFNAEPESEEMRRLTGLAPSPVEGVFFHDAWRYADPGDPGITWSNDNPNVRSALEHDRRIDFVLVGWPKANGRGHVTSVEVFGTEPVDGVHPSDHYGVTAELLY